MLSVLRNVLGVCARQDHMVSCARALYSPARLGVDSYQSRRTRISLQLADSTGDLWRRMDAFAEGHAQFVSKDELDQMLHVVTASESDQSLLLKIIIRFHEQTRNLRSSNFVFGTVAMRMYWHHELPDRALEAFHCSELDGFFDQISSYTILMDLLYKQRRYSDVRVVLEEVKSRRLFGTQYPTEGVVLAIASCYQQNTAESCEHVRALLTRLEEIGHSMPRRAATLAAALFIRQEAPHEALKLVRQRNDANTYAVLRDLQAITLAELGRPAEALELLRRPLLADLPLHARGHLSVVAEAIDSVEAAVQKKNDAEVTSNWQSVKSGLGSYGLIKDKTLHQLVTSLIEPSRKASPSALGASFNRGKWRQQPAQRRGLADMD